MENLLKGHVMMQEGGQKSNYTGNFSSGISKHFKTREKLR